jgi:hypothetical protein
MGTLALSGALEDDDVYVAATELYAELELEQALYRFQEVALNPALTPREKAYVYSWIGLCYSGLGEAGTSEDIWRTALELSIDVPLPPVASPKLKSEFEKLRATERTKQQQAAAAEAPPPEEEPAPRGPVVSEQPATTARPARPARDWDSDRPSFPILAVGGSTLLVGGVAAGVGSAIFGYLTTLSLEDANDQSNFQDVAADHVRDANWQGTTSLALGIAGGVLFVGGAGLATAGLMSE